MELGLYTDSVDKLTRTEAFDLAARIGATGIEIAMGGQSSAPHADIKALLNDSDERKLLKAWKIGAKFSNSSQMPDGWYARFRRWKVSSFDIRI